MNLFKWGLTNSCKAVCHLRVTRNVHQETLGTISSTKTDWKWHEWFFYSMQTLKIGALWGRKLFRAKAEEMRGDLSVLAGIKKPSEQTWEKEGQQLCRNMQNEGHERKSWNQRKNWERKVGGWRDNKTTSRLQAHLWLAVHTDKISTLCRRPHPQRTARERGEAQTVIGFMSSDCYLLTHMDNKVQH